MTTPTQILNIGCGKDTYGTARIDLYETSTTTNVLNIDIDKLPFPDKTFNEIYCKSLLEHLKNLDNFEKECFRVLKKGGKLIIKTDYAGYIMWNIDKAHEHNELLMPYYEKDGYGHEIGEDAHYHLFVASHLLKLFKRFRNHKITYNWGGRNRLAHWILGMLPFHLGCSEIDLECVK